MVVFSIVMLGVASSTVLATQTNRDSHRQAVAVNLAHQVVECVKAQLQAGRTVNLATGNNAGIDCNPGTTQAGFQLTGVSVTPNPTGFDGLTRVQATIGWSSPVPDRVTLDWLVDTNS